MDSQISVLVVISGPFETLLTAYDKVLKIYWLKEEKEYFKFQNHNLFYWEKASEIASLTFLRKKHEFFPDSKSGKYPKEHGTSREQT